MRKVFIPIIGVLLLSLAFVFVFSDNRGEASSSAQVVWDEEKTIKIAEIEFEAPIFVGSVEAQARHTVGVAFGNPFEHYIVCVETPTFDTCENVPPSAMNIDFAQGLATVDADISCGNVKYRIAANTVSGKFRETVQDSASTEMEFEQGKFKEADVIGGEVCGFNLNLADDSEGNIEVVDIKEKF